jgi:hypothetical protein
MTPASKRAMDDLRLAAQARLRLARHLRTARADFSVRAHDGALTVTYLPKDMDVAEHVRPALEGLAGATSVAATVATSNILWVQERFDAASETFGEIVEIAQKWHAAVELVRFAVGDGSDGEAPAATPVVTAEPAVEAGIEEDACEEATDESGLRETLDALAALGRSGGGRTVCGPRGRLLAACCGTVQYSLVVVGNVFLNKGAAARLRLTRELQDGLASRLRVPVVTADELRRQYLFGTRDALRLVVFLATVAVLYAVVFSHQPEVLTFLRGGWTDGRLAGRLAIAAAVFAFVPLVAYSLGTVVRAFMKLVKME